MPIRHRLAAAAAAALALLAVGACSSASRSSAEAHASSGGARISSIAAQPTTSADIAAAEALLLANWQKETKARPGHPYLAARAAIKDTFPTGDTGKIVSYGISQFNITMIHSTQARHTWAQLVVAYALKNGGATSPPGSADIPGVTASPSPATTTAGNG